MSFERIPLRWIAAICVCWLTSAALAAQPAASPSDDDAPQQAADDDLFPRVRLVYYAGREGNGSKEAVIVDLTEWTPDKDVYIEYGWNDPEDDDTQSQEEPAERDYSLPAPRQRVWKVRYEAAGTQGKSRVFVSGFGSVGKARIYFDGDFISFIFLGGTGWYELGAEGRLVRYLQSRRPQTTAPTPTRSQ
jgi:hypothetical protein